MSEVDIVKNESYDRKVSVSVNSVDYCKSFEYLYIAQKNRGFDNRIYTNYISLARFGLRKLANDGDIRAAQALLINERELKVTEEERERYREMVDPIKIGERISRDIIFRSKRYSSASDKLTFAETQLAGLSRQYLFIEQNIQSKRGLEIDANKQTKDHSKSKSSNLQVAGRTIGLTPAKHKIKMINTKTNQSASRFSSQKQTINRNYEFISIIPNQQTTSETNFNLNKDEIHLNSLKYAIGCLSIEVEKMRGEGKVVTRK